MRWLRWQQFLLTATSYAGGAAGANTDPPGSPGVCWASDPRRRFRPTDDWVPALNLGSGRLLRITKIQSSSSCLV